MRCGSKEIADVASEFKWLVKEGRAAAVEIIRSHAVVELLEAEFVEAPYNLLNSNVKEIGGLGEVTEDAINLQLVEDDPCSSGCGGAREP